jgi:probable rRNA maturation factor
VEKHSQKPHQVKANILFHKSKIKFSLSNKAKITKWIEAVVKKERKQIGSLNFIFCSDTALLAMNKRYLNHDYFTDIITFDFSEGKAISGDIHISIDRVRENAAEMGVAFHVELSRVIIHGVLHLLGYSDKTITRKKEMRKKEDECLALLN